jgi:hypothetical protein
MGRQPSATPSPRSGACLVAMLLQYSTYNIQYENHGWSGGKVLLSKVDSMHAINFLYPETAVDRMGRCSQMSYCILLCTRGCSQKLIACVLLTSCTEQHSSSQLSKVDSMHAIKS